MRGGCGAGRQVGRDSSSICSGEAGPQADAGGAVQVPRGTHRQVQNAACSRVCGGRAAQDRHGENREARAAREVLGRQGEAGARMRFAAALVLAGCAGRLAPAQVDPALAGTIQATKAIDNHAHPLRYVAEGQKPDDEYDALPCDTLPQAQGPMRTRLENPEWIGAWRALYGYKYNDATPEHIKELVAAKEGAKREHGAEYAAWVLDKMGIE